MNPGNVEVIAFAALIIIMGVLIVNIWKMIDERELEKQKRLELYERALKALEKDSPTIEREPEKKERKNNDED